MTPSSSYCTHSLHNRFHCFFNTRSASTNYCECDHGLKNKTTLTLSDINFNSTPEAVHQPNVNKILNYIKQSFDKNSTNIDKLECGFGENPVWKNISILQARCTIEKNKNPEFIEGDVPAREILNPDIYGLPTPRPYIRKICNPTNSSSIFNNEISAENRHHDYLIIIVILLIISIFVIFFLMFRRWRKKKHNMNTNNTQENDAVVEIEEVEDSV